MGERGNDERIVVVLRSAAATSSAKGSLFSLPYDEIGVMVAPTVRSRCARRWQSVFALACATVGALLLIYSAFPAPLQMVNNPGARRRGGPQPRLAAADFFTLNES